MAHAVVKPLVAYFVIVLLLPCLGFFISRLPRLESQASIETIILVLAWSPTAVALVLTWAIEGSAGVHALLRRLLISRARIVWLAVALLLPAGLRTVQILIAHATGAAAPLALAPDQLLGNFAITIVTGATGEELGWRGFALPRLQAQFSPLVSTLILGTIWAVWHIPAFFLFGRIGLSISVLPALLTIPALAFLLTLVFNLSGGSVLAPIVAHVTLNFTDAMGGIRLSPVTVVTGLALPWLMALAIVLLFPSFRRPEDCESAHA